MVALGRNALAFSYGWRKPALYVARLGGADRRVGQGGLPLGWTSAGLYTHRGRALRLLGSEGAVRATIAHHVVHVAFDAIGHGIWYVAGGALFWAHEPSVRRIAHVRR